MAKKSSKKSRKRRQTNVPVYSVPTTSRENQSKPRQSSVAAARPPISNALASKDATTDSIDWAKEYPFYAPDMKRLGVVVALMVLLLLAMNILFIYVL